MKVDKLLIHLVLIVYFIITIFLSIYSYKLLIVFLGISALIFFITKLRRNFLINRHLARMRLLLILQRYSNLSKSQRGETNLQTSMCCYSYCKGTQI